MQESVLCLKRSRSGLFNYTCLDFPDSGFEYNCRNCDWLLTVNFKKYLIKVKKLEIFILVDVYKMIFIIRHLKKLYKFSNNLQIIQFLFE